MSKTNYHDIPIRNGTVITVDDNNSIIRNGALYIKENIILDIGDSDDLSRKYSKSEKVIDANRNLVIPGLIK